MIIGSKIIKITIKQVTKTIIKLILSYCIYELKIINISNYFKLIIYPIEGENNIINYITTHKMVIIFPNLDNTLSIFKIPLVISNIMQFNKISNKYIQL